MRMTLVLAASLLGVRTGIWTGTNHAAPPHASTGAGRTSPAAQPQAAPLTLESAPPPVSAEEDAAFKAFNDVPNDDPAKKDQVGEEFLQKYPQSRYRGEDL